MDNLDKQIMPLCKGLKFNETLKKYDYLCYAIKLRYKQKIYMKLYEKIVVTFNTSKYSIERNIRYVIDTSWSYSYSDYHSFWYRSVAAPKMNKPCASKFIERSIEILHNNFGYNLY